MKLLFRFQEPWLLYCAGIWILLVCLLRYVAYKPVTYKHSLGNFIAAHAHSGTMLFWLHNLFRLSTLVLLALLVARPQWSSERHIVAIDGIDIVVALDVSGSMDTHDFADDDRSRFEVARAE